MTDCDPNPCTFRRGIQHVEETTSHAQVTTPSAKPFIGSDFGYFCVRDELIPRRTTALGVHFFIHTEQFAPMSRSNWRRLCESFFSVTLPCQQDYPLRLRRQYQSLMINVRQSHVCSLRRSLFVFSAVVVSGHLLHQCHSFRASRNPAKRRRVLMLPLS